jgi:hypothetical protein
MWIWGTIFGLGRDASRYAMRGLGCVFVLAFVVAVLAALGSSMMAGRPEKLAAVAVGAASISGAASLHDNARNVAQGYRDAPGLMHWGEHSERDGGDIVAEWEHDRREAEAKEASWYED